MSLRALALNWSADGSLGLTFAVVVAALGCAYVFAAQIGTSRDRRQRPWPRGRTFCFLGGLAVLLIDLHSGIGTEADTRLSAHMIEHTLMWVVVAPLLAAGAPLRLAFFALPRAQRRTLANWLHSRPASVLTGPVTSVSLFSGVLLISHLPAVYGLALRDDYVHEAIHAVYLLTALLVWAPLVGADPLPHRPGPRGQLACIAACMVPMALIAVWLGAAPAPVYARYLHATGPAALHDQRVAAAIMLIGCVPAFLVPAAKILRRHRVRRVRQERAAAVPLP